MKSSEKPVIVGLDIGTTKVVAIAGRIKEFSTRNISGAGHEESADVTKGIA